MKKQIFFFLGLLLLMMWLGDSQLVHAQNSTEMGYVPPLQQELPRRSLRIVFEGTFRGKQNVDAWQPGFMTTSLYPNDMYMKPNNYSGLSLNTNEILFGFDANFTKKSGRHFTLSSRTRFTSSPDSFDSKETWLKLHTKGAKPSSIVIDFSIRIVR